MARPVPGGSRDADPALLTSAPVFYSELADWWPLLSAPSDYQEEATYYASMLVEHSPARPSMLLELGSGGGNNASWMKRSFQGVTLVDLSPGMLAVSSALNPECEHVVGDMRSVRLGRVFDCVFVHDAISYAATRDDLRRVFETARVHCKPSGVALFAPDYVRETFHASTDHGGRDGEERSLRYLEWVWDPDPDDTTYLAEYAFLLRESDGRVRVVHDRHVEGVFSKSEWTRLLEEAGFDVFMRTLQHSDFPVESLVFLGVAR